MILWLLPAGKKSSGKAARDESMVDKKHELEKRLETVKGTLGTAPASSKKPTKKGFSFTRLPPASRRVHSTPTELNSSCERPMRALRHNAPLIRFVILALYMLFACLYHMLHMLPHLAWLSVWSEVQTCIWPS